MKYSNSIFILKNRFLRPSAFLSYKKALQYEQLFFEGRKIFDFQSRVQLVSSAYKNTRFYKEYYDKKGFHPDMLVTESDWEKVPILEKKMIREHSDELVAEGIDTKKLGRATTGGTTGTPLKVYKDKNSHYEVLGWRAFSWYGISPADNVGQIYRNVPQSSLRRLINRLIWWPTKRAYCDASTLTDKNIEDFIADIKKQQTVWLVGYCGALEYLAGYVLKHEIRLNSIRLVWSTSSPLTMTVRKKLESAFLHAKVMDQYGCCEMPNIAVQKPDEPFLTINSDFVHVDIVDEKNHLLNESHEYGDILITDLKSAVYPLIKYRLGDKSRIIKTIQESADGFPKLEFVQGRISDALLFPDGTFVDGSYLTTICDNYVDLVDSYQVFQKMDYSVELKIVLKPGCQRDDRRISDILTTLIIKTKNQVPVILKFVDKIDTDRGKRQFIISEILLEKINQ
jgi:phenylacetate-CoA ligase